MLKFAGWDAQYRNKLNLFDPNRPGVATQEAHLKTGFADYLLVVGGKALGIMEAKKVGVPLSRVEIQSARYVGLSHTRRKCSILGCGRPIDAKNSFQISRSS